MAKKKASFDSKRIRQATHKVVYDAFGKFGAYGMAGARNSIKKAPKTNKPLDADQVAVKGEFGRVASKPGRPPYSHKGSLKKSIRFAVDRQEKSVVIGPMQYKGYSDGAKALEEGGTVVKKIRINAPPPKGPPKKPAPGKTRPQGFRRFYSSGSRKESLKSEGFKRWLAEQERIRKNIVVKTVPIKIKKRPFMDPAFAEAKNRLPELFDESTQKFK